MSKHTSEALSASDRELFRAKARESVAIMRGHWDTKQAAARQTVLDAGVHYNDADHDAFRRAVEPMKRRWMADETIAASRRLAVQEAQAGA